MPSTQSVPEPVTDGGQHPSDTGASTAANASAGATIALPPPVPDTATTRAVWAVLSAGAEVTVAEMAEAASVSRSTVSKTLIILEEAGLALRASGVRDGARRQPDLWRTIPTERSAAEIEATQPGSEEVVEPLTVAATADAETVGVEIAEAPEPAPSGDGQSEAALAGSDSQPATGGGKSRLGSGKLREMVLGHLREHPSEEFSPTALGKVLGHSAGAISNALERLVDTEDAVESNPKPRRYRYRERT